MQSNQKLVVNRLWSGVVVAIIAAAFSAVAVRAVVVEYFYRMVSLCYNKFVDFNFLH